MPIKFTNEQFCFFPIPKTASTSIKSMFFPEQQNIELLHKATRAINFYKITSEEKEEIQNWQKATIIRNPIERAISCYRQKIYNTNHFKLMFERKDSVHGLSEHPTFSEFVTNLNLYFEYSPMIKHHMQPTTFFLGENPKYFTKIFKLSEINQFKDYAETILNKKLTLATLNVTKNKLDVIYFDSVAFNTLKDFYNKDYTIFEFDSLNFDDMRVVIN